MSDKDVLRLHDVVHYHMPNILLQRTEEIFPALNESMICTVSTGVVPCTPVETNITSSDEAHGVSGIKVEEDADVHIKEEIPEPITFPSTKTEPEESTANNTNTYMMWIVHIQLVHSVQHWRNRVIVMVGDNYIPVKCAINPSKE
jgi:hypothetical protein